MRIEKEKLLTLWFEDREGNVELPDPETGDVKDPDRFMYQHFRSPLTLTTRVSATVLEKEVESCAHPSESIRPTYGWIDGTEGRECANCGGSQIRSGISVRKKWEPKWFWNLRKPAWPKEWKAEGSYEILIRSTSVSEDLVLALVMFGNFKLGEAILISATACERCLNVLAYDHNLRWGYEEGGDEWKEARTSCQFCEHMDKE